MVSQIQAVDNIAYQQNQIAPQNKVANPVADYPDDKFEKQNKPEPKSEKQSGLNLLDWSLIGATGLSTTFAAFKTHKLGKITNGLGNILTAVGKEIPKSVDDILSQIQKTITVDKLTGLFNRGFLDANLPKDYKAAIQSGKSFCVGMMDMDKFKSVNDTLGHSTGDTFLEEIAKCMNNVAEKHGAKAYRYGGEEFMITAVGQDKATSKTMMDEIAVAIKENKVIQGHKDKFIQIATDKLNFAKAQLDLIGRDGDYNIFRKLSDSQEGKLRNGKFKALANDVSVIINEYVTNKNPNNKKDLLAFVENLKSGKNISTLLRLKTPVGESNLGIELNNILKKHTEDYSTFKSGLQHLTDTKGKFTISGGFVNVSDGNVVKNPTHLQKIADAASYAAKSQGRNRNIEADDAIIKNVLAKETENSK